MLSLAVMSVTNAAAPRRCHTSTALPQEAPICSGVGTTGKSSSYRPCGTHSECHQGLRYAWQPEGTNFLASLTSDSADSPCLLARQRASKARHMNHLPRRPAAVMNIWERVSQLRWVPAG